MIGATKKTGHGTGTGRLIKAEVQKQRRVKFATVAHLLHALAGPLQAGTGCGRQGAEDSPSCASRTVQARPAQLQCGLGVLHDGRRAYTRVMRPDGRRAPRPSCDQASEEESGSLRGSRLWRIMRFAACRRPSLLSALTRSSCVGTAHPRGRRRPRQSLSITGQGLDRWICRSRLTLRLWPRPYTSPLSCYIRMWRRRPCSWWWPLCMYEWWCPLCSSSDVFFHRHLNVCLNALACCEAALDRQIEPAFLAKGG